MGLKYCLAFCKLLTGFGYTSAEGSVSEKECRLVSQLCPIGQWAAPDAVSAEECRCYRGFGGKSVRRCLIVCKGCAGSPGQGVVCGGGSGSAACWPVQSLLSTPLVSLVHTQSKVV
jgi:hypothetical protein